ncbi:major facilitator superfamily domain-containing protein 6-like [Plakobranchus ocellatus]|uniref:Major facilitator superfamily domain-containing protein 6-like n=1 Tax=Plakobranchus ocellatus TaxID=259542 RepID=A0AAV4D4B9_9GAST|nr:major facilitator superfamily domain-containing protein 6-like [Plakobranchus ocellatus]
MADSNDATEGNKTQGYAGLLTNEQADGHTRFTVNRDFLPLKVLYFSFYGAAETGVVTGVPLLLAIFLRTAIGVAADKMAARKAFLMFCCGGFGLVFFLLRFVPPRAISKSLIYSAENISDLQGPGVQSYLERSGNFWVCLAPDGTQLCRYPNTPGHTPCQLLNQDRISHLPLPQSKRTSQPPNPTQLLPGNNLIKGYILEPGQIANDLNVESEQFEQNSSLKQLQNLREDPSPNIKRGTLADGGYANKRPCFILAKSGLRSLDVGERKEAPTYSLVREVESQAGTEQPLPVPLLMQNKTKTREITETCLLNCRPLHHRLNESLTVVEDTSSPQAFRADTAFIVSFLLVTTARALYSSATSLADVVAFTTLGPNALKWGRQRLWGTVGTALSVMIATTINDQLKDGGFDALFYVCLGLCLLATVVGLGNVRLFLLKLVAYGIMCGTAENFFPWFLVDLGAKQTTLGLCIAAHSISSVSVLRYSSRIFRLVSHANILYLVMAVYAIRFLAFSVLGNAWLAVPLELLKGVTYSLTYMAASYTASQMAPAGTEASCQAIAGALYWDLGRGLGILLAGHMIQIIGGRWTFRLHAGICALLLPVFWLLDRTWPITEQHRMSIAMEKDPESIDKSEIGVLRDSTEQDQSVSLETESSRS